jgi:hypothetical protein
VYENALGHRLRKRGLNVKQQHAISVYDEDGTVLGRENRLRFLPLCGLKDHSLRMAWTGSSRAARMAGIMPATTPTAERMVLETISADNDTAR